MRQKFAVTLVNCGRGNTFFVSNSHFNVDYKLTNIEIFLSYFLEYFLKFSAIYDVGVHSFIHSLCKIKTNLNLSVFIFRSGSFFVSNSLV